MSLRRGAPTDGYDLPCSQALSARNAQTETKEQDRSPADAISRQVVMAIMSLQGQLTDPCMGGW